MVTETIICSEDDLPVLKEIVAKELHSKGYSQTAISKLLDITQPMVSVYLKNNSTASKTIIASARRFTDLIKDDRKAYFQSCITTAKVEGGFYLGKKEELLTDERQDVIDNVLRAVNILQTFDLNGLIPKIKVNLAMSLKDPERMSDVASIAGGMVFVNNKLAYYGPVGFENSKHLASLIFRMKGTRYRSIMNIKYSKYTGLGLKVYGYRDKGFPSARIDTDIIIHKGAFGIEPCSYIIGTDAVDVVGKLAQLTKIK
ncbi:hypothetical protein K9M79_02090 [Candidatus Woesearchaeota archaeon]|nr:hypothetical protein [Candidatus Woesearchaeota archaeon]